MIGALIIAALPLININWLSENRLKVGSMIKRGTSLMILLLLIQIILGTQVREEIDIISKSLSYEGRELWIGQLSSIFDLHRSFSWIILLGCIALYFRGRVIPSYLPYIRNIVLVLFVIILLGIIMNYLNMPALAQPLHLLLASALLMQLFYTRLKMG